MQETQKLELQYNKEGKIYSPLGKRYKVATPEEIIRQKFVCTLVNSYKYNLEQMQEEVKTQKGKNAARADIVIWKSPKDKQDKNPPLIIVECKADTIRISEGDYAQGESYARLTNAPFFVTHNNYETRFWRVIKDKMPGFTQEIANIPENNASDKEIDKLLKDLVVFKEDEFAKILWECHCHIRDNDKFDPTKAFDEIAKILFMKVYVERKLIKGEADNKFTIEYVKEAEKYNPNYLEWLFNETKKEFAKDQIFIDNEKIELKNATIYKIIERLQIYNLSNTSSDIKGVAFEKFLGQTFRGELGQFFTPRPIVEFMIEMINPQENEVSCDPASGSGGFLIRIFSKVRELIQQDIIKQYEAYKQSIVKDINNITDIEAKKLTSKKNELEKQLETDTQGTRLFKLSNHCIYGTDANDRMARTSKMNMIMHGDGHGGIHHHDGLLNINGIFENRFDIILTNPPFGSNVRKENTIRAEDAQTYLNNNGEVSYTEEKKEQIENYYKTYGKETYQNAQRKILDNIGKPIASLFALKPNLESDKTEHLFINRCLDLLKPGVEWESFCQKVCLIRQMQNMCESL
ncbi:type I restriction enzyme HsdR N-terminal domain-containing protein [Helicobacter sp. XJK30-2]|uniref:Type I restriction enzyme HsdR N-terminal domain-containing protein n=1 Tax=Helicobacter zhangjianzhongii TaxID=2974574 RepID=A0ACC6FRR3_9HELI|nr:N-6 DNA methylase [Helicobacter sp. XJK30-2]MDL0081807.1 type I restriction enzyme HsdR N-terminal domain-containing protein [Helicobacter sp. XJK30-2]